MASEVVCGLIFRLLLPICLATACLFRYNGLSFVYLIYLLLIPLFAEPTSTTMQGHTGRLLMSLCFSSLSFLLFHIIYQITVNSLLAGNNIDRAFNCSTWEKSIRQIGFESVIGADAGNGIRVFLPDIGMFLAGLACLLLCRSLFQKRPPEDMAQDNTDYEPEGEEEEEKLSLDDNVLLDEDFEAGYEAGEEEEEEMEEEEEEDEEEEESNKMKILRHIAGVASKVKEIIGNLITTAGKVVVTILLGLTGITLPSLTSAVYFFVFLFLCTWWSFCRTFDTLIFSCMCVLMAIFSAGHLVVLYLYQFQFFQESIPPEDSYISLFGISSIIQTDCSSTWRMIVNPELAWHHFVNPIMLLLLYYTLATLIRLWLQEPIEEPIEVGNTLVSLIVLWLQEEEPIEVGNTLVSLILLWLQEPIEEEEPIEVGNTLVSLILLWLQEEEEGPIEEEEEVGNTLVSLILIWLQEEEDDEEEEGEDGEEEEEEAVGNGTRNSADKRRQLWWKAHQRTEERNGLAEKSNGTSCDISTLNSVENRPVGLDLYSTPQYKMDQTNNITEKKNGSVFDISPTVGGETAGIREEEKKEEQGNEEEEEEEEGRVNAVVTVFRFIMKQSYICALIAMMAWSITYVSWLTFVFLMWSCLLWMVRDRRRYTMLTSPFMVLYGNLLIVLQYIWSFELLEPVPGLFLKKEVPFSELGSKVLCLLSFWLLLRQTLTERNDKQREEDAVLTDVHVDNQPKKKEEEEDEEGGEQDIVQVLGNMVMEMLVKYWIYICGGMFFFVSFEGRMVMYKIIYMMLFLFCVALYQVHYEYWRRILKYFWMSVVVYTMLVLVLVYTFQFETSLPFWSNMTGMSEEKLKDLGLEQFSVSMLFTSIFIPTSFLLVCILHLHYFHDRFLLLTDLKAVTQKQDSAIYRLVHQDGSLADITMLSISSGEGVIRAEDKKEKKIEKEKEGTLVVVMEEKDGGMKQKGGLCQSIDLHQSFNKSFESRQSFGKSFELHQSFHKSFESSAGPGESGHCSVGTEPDPSTENTTSDLKNKWHLVVDRLTVLFLKFLEYFHKLQLFIWWLLEIHIIKIVSSYIILVSVKEVSLFNYVFLACWAFALPFSQFRPLASSICTVWTCVIIVCKMLYQLESIQPASYSKNCSMPMNYTQKQREEMKDSLLYKEPVDPSNWVGLNKFNPLLENLRNNLLMLAMLAFEVTIYRHQQYYRLRNKLTAPAARIIFHDITRQHLDNGIVNCAKYFINYFFYKFGLETCFLLAVNVIGQRMDFYAMLHAFSLIAVMYRRRRKAIAEIWPKYCCFQACILTWQYFVCIGIPPAACKDYPWRFPNSAMDSNVIKWLYFPDFHTNPNPIFLVYDFMLLLCASLQRSIFDEENKAAVRLMAGDNVEICRDLDAASFSVHNPVPDFIHCRSYLDMLKVIMFSYLFWFVLTIIFITGTTRISLFCLGYLVGCFYFLLFGGELLLKPIKKILHYWDFLIAYNVFVITMKNILSILACGYINVLVVNNCWLIQLLSLACTIKEYKVIINRDVTPGDGGKKCDLPSDEAGIIWDSICFAFLLLQRRVFMSYYFLHVVADIRASQILASRGAELFQATIVKAVRARLEEENKSMEQLKRQMDRIKQRQEKFKSGKKKMLSLAQESGDRENPIQPQESGYRENPIQPQESGDRENPIQEQEEEDDGAEREREKVKEKETAKTKKRQWWRPWVDHASMVRSGDYYLFETDSEEEEEEEETREDQELPKKSAFQFVYHAWITDSKTAMKERSKEKRKFWKRYTKRDKHKKDKKEGHVTIEMEEDQEGPQEKKSDGPDNILKRVFNIIKFTWVLFQTTVESFTKWMNNVCREHIDISTVLRIERCMLTREVKKGNVPSRESIHVFYQKQMRMNMSRGSSLDRLSEEDSGSGGSHRVHRRRGDYRMESQDSMASLASRDSISSAYTEATMLFSRQDTLDELDGMPSDVPIPKTSERARPKLRKIYGLDASKSTDSSSSQVSSETTQCITLYSRQGTTDTIEEVEDEQDQGEDRQHGPWGHPPPEGEEGDEDRENTEERERYQGQGDPWGSPGPGEGPSFRVEEGASTLLALREGSRPGSQDCTTDSDDGGVQYRQEYLNTEKRDRAGLLYTPDTDAPNTSDADVPPSYSKAVSFDRLEVSEDESDRDDNRMMAMTPDTSRSDYLDDPLLPSLTTELTASELLLNKMFHDEELERSERFYMCQPLALQLVYALYNMLVAHSEMVCYLVIILNNMLSASCVTLVLPILIFLWAMLSVPRPSKRFWMTAIVYTEVTIVIKYFFQFGFFPFNQNPKVDVKKPYHPPNIIGVEKKDGYVVYDLIQLLALFFHRSILKCHGLWDEDNLKDTKKEILHRDTESEDDERREREATPVSSTPRERKGSTQTLRSINLGMGTSMDSVHIPVHYLQQQQQTYQRRKSSSGGSHISHRSVHSVRSKRGSTNSRNSSHRDGSESVQQKTKKQLMKEKLREQMIKAKTFTIKRTMEVYLPIRQFFYNLVHPEYSAVTDVYVLMFLADTIDFIIIVFGFSAFGKHSAGADITSSLSEDQVPGAFLVMVLIQFGTMVVDRALYLKKTVLGKVIFQVALVFGIHFWMFFILPVVTERRFNENTVAKLWYCIKCIYFGLSAYQIRCGYPTRVLGNFLTKSYNYANLFLFQGFRLIPFLTELRAVMDWVWTDTSLSLSSWICVEDIYAHIFVLKCWRESERRYPQPRGQAKKPVVKYGMGGMIVMLLICIIWFPLLFMSLVKSVVGVVNRPLDVSFSITLAGFQPIFTMSAQQNQLREVSSHEFHGTFMRSYLSDPVAMQWLESYVPEDLTIAELEGSSNSLWTISPPSRTNIMKMLSSKEQFPITLAWSIQRNQTLGAKAEFATGKKVMFLDDNTKLELFLLLNGTRKDGVVIKHGFPRYLRAPTDSEAKPIEQLSGEELFITLALERFHNDSAEVQEWWIVNQTSPGKIKVRSPKNLYNAGLELYVFSDQVSPPSLGFLAGYGIMGLYASVVLVIGKFVREFFSGISHTIMFEELPNVDRILKLCTDIFLVRETGELDLEEDMYAKLIFLYRSPETMIKWTREKTQ
ncbi:piezo-type mechanosensitive ion channel component 2 [Salmo salar]|uniref:Piezo-type mechanosensitive ion channel component 2 n=1 Tax=Salmo salar TaxID=8030 RepID=A0ABM3CSV3_SALSA|nr:piezo-type mechanosensitive ion channel component 2 [Salmo salar]